LVLDNYRSSLDWWLVPLAKAFRRVNPDVFTWLALACAVGGGVSFWLAGPADGRRIFLLAAFVFVGLNSVFDLLDGKIAHLTARATPRGDFLDHSIDRFSDAAFLIGISLSAFGSPKIGLAALLGTLLASYMGTQAQAVGLRRNYSGLLGRADRMVLMMAVPLLEYAWPWTGRSVPFGMAGWLEILLVYFAVMGTLTAAQRFVSSLRGFDRDGNPRQ
jgi:archaetidylinositol phosphate synthase